MHASAHPVCFRRLRLRPGSAPLLPLAPLLLAAIFFTAPLSAATTLNGDEALRTLREGDARFQSGQPMHPRQSVERRTEVANGQNPIATIIACADSRVAPEILFDQGLGDLFVVRVAGNVANVDQIGSTEYGVEHLGTPVLVVLGHSQCGAVTAVAQGAEVHGNILQAVAGVAPAVAAAKAAAPNAPFERLLAEAVKLNVWNTIDEVLKASPILRDRIKSGKLKVIGAVYDLRSGAVEWLGTHPEQGRLLAYTSGPAGHSAPEGAAHAVTSASDHGASLHADSRAPAGEAVAPDRTAVEPQTLRWIVGPGIGTILILGALGWFNGRLRRWTVGRRIGLGFGTVLVLLGITGFFGFESLLINYHEFLEYQADARHSNLMSDVQIEFLEMQSASKDYLNTRNPADIESFSSRRTRLEASLAKARTEIAHPDRRKMTETIRSQLDDYTELFAKIVAATRHGGAAPRDLSTRFARLGDTIDHEAEQLQRTFVADQEELGPRVQADMAEARVAVASTALAAFVVGIAFAWQISQALSSTLRATASELAQGAQQVASASSQVSGASQTLASGASEQAASVEETSSSLEEISSMTKRNADAAHETRNLAGHTRAAAEAGAQNMAEMQQAMDAIKESSSNIARIVKTIDEIAFQTNILALNAAVEAARAGSAGAGFAVVADEVRALAQRSAQSAKETSAMIDEAIARSDRGAQISTKVAEALSEIVAKVRQVDTLVEEIARASHEQTQGLGQINTAVAQIDSLTQANAASSEESAAAAEELLAQASTMRETVKSLEQLVGVTRSDASPTMRPAASTHPALPAHPPVTAPVRTAAPAAPEPAANGHPGFFVNGHDRNGYGLGTERRK